MRTEPENNSNNTTELKAGSQAKMDAITRKVAILFVLAIVVFFFFKMLLP
jgi:hypothetical protein